MSVTSMTGLRDAAGGVEVSVPGFTSGEIITLKIKRPSLIEMAAQGRIPNPLMSTAAQLFKSGAKKEINEMSDGDKFKELAEAIHCVVKAALVEPSYEELTNNGVELTDVQLLYIYDYVQTGIDQLKSIIKKKT